MDGYTREQFPHWSDAQEYGWRLPAGSGDAREAALIRDGTEEVVGGCSVGADAGSTSTPATSTSSPPT
jgi:hypothetical protein